MSIAKVLAKFIKDTLTEVDNDHFDVMRISLVLGVIGFIGLSAYAVWKTGTFDLIAFGTGYGTLMGAGGAGIGARQKLEKPIKEQDSA